MSTLILEHESRASEVTFTQKSLVVTLNDGRRLSVPLTWFPRLLHGTRKERSRVEFIGNGEGIHWPELDEDISVEGLLSGLPSRESQTSLRNWLIKRTPENGQANTRVSRR